MRAFGGIAAAALCCVALAGCAAGSDPMAAVPGISPRPVAAVPLDPPDTPMTMARPPENSTPATAPAPPAPSASRPATPKKPVTASPTPPPPDTRKGTALDKPYEVDGIAVVSKEHLLGPGYKPPDQVGSFGLTRETAEAVKKLQAGAKKDGITVKIRSGYRSYATQKAMLKQKVHNYENIEAAERYIAPAGSSEHQLGTTVDFWDGRVWGNDIGDTKLNKWLWKHAREYGFILRYPPGKEKITGFAYEPWHFRYLGVGVSMKFKPDTKLTLEEYLGLA